MRNIVMFNRVSADGYFASADGRLDWTVPEPELDKAAAENLGGSDTILFGRRTYDMFESFWPTVAGDSPIAPDPHAAGRSSPEIRAMANWINAATKIVFSKKRKDVTWHGSRLLREIDPREIEALKNQPGKAMMIFGSGTVVSELTRHGLIDEYQLIVGPVLLGRGKPWLAGLDSTVRLELVEEKRFPSGNVRLRYVRGR